MFLKAPGLLKKLRPTSGGLDTHTTFAAVIEEKFEWVAWGDTQSRRASPLCALPLVY